MAVTNEQVLAEIMAYSAANGRPCPANHLTAKFGDEALDVINTMKKEGKLLGKRGRTGGLVTTSTVASAEVETDDNGNIVNVNDTTLADQFAELAAKLAAEEINAAAAVG